MEATDLEPRLCRALDIAQKALKAFAVNGYADLEAPQNSFRPEKLIAETALLAYGASGARRLSSVAGRIDEIAEALALHARSQRTILNVALHPSLCLDFAVPHVLLTRLGYRDTGFDEFLRRCLIPQVRSGHERPPFGSLEQYWLQSLWTGESPGPQWNITLNQSVLNHPIDILGGLRDDAYAFTHLLLYCTDFGFRPARLPRSRSRILAEASSLLAKCLDEENYDLAGEVLMAWPLTGARWGASASFGFRVLLRVEDQAGVLPSGLTKTDRLRELQGSERDEYVLATAYHTAYVMGLLCAASLLPGRVPFALTAGPRKRKPFLDLLLTVVGRDQGHWQQEFGELTESEQFALVPFLLDIAIVQSCRRKDYDGVRDLLVAACHHGIATSPLCGQAAELMERLSASSLYMSSRIPQM